MENNPKLIFMLDVLGFESFYISHGFEKTQRYYCNLIDYVQKQEGELVVDFHPIGNGLASPILGFFGLEHCYYSDTLLFWTNYNSFLQKRFFDRCAEIICTSLELGFTVRGAIAAGDATLDNSKKIYFGPPLFEAAHVEKAQTWIGASFGPSFNNSPYNKNLYPQLLNVYRRHRKQGYEYYIPGLVLDWPRKWRETRKKDLHSVIKNLDRDPKYSHYYKITHDFIDFSISNHDWFMKKSPTFNSHKNPS